MTLAAAAFRALLAALLLFGAALAQPGPDPAALPVEGLEVLEPAPFNAAIAAALAAGEGWPLEPDRIVRELAGGFDARVVVLTLRYDRPEAPTRVAATLLRDGLLDDSVRGDRHEVVLQRQHDGSWRVLEVRRALRCRRGPATDRFVAGPCP